MPKLRNFLTLTILVAMTGVVQAAQVKIATLAPEGSGWMQAMRDGAREIKERTDGRLTVKLYGGGIMGSDKTVLRKMRSGQLQGATFTSSGLAERYPDFQLYSLPMLFESIGEAEYVRERMDQTLLDGLDDAGLISFGFAQGGFAVLMSNKPIRSLDDVKGQKVWVPEGDVPSQKAMVAMGVSPVVLPLTDVLMGLQTGLIDIVATSPVGAVVLQWHTKVKYITEVPLAYIIGTLVVEKKAFEKLEPADQEVFAEVITRLYRGFDNANLADNESATTAMTNQGVIGIVPETKNVIRWRTVVMDSNRQLAAQGEFSAILLDEALALAAEYRQQLEHADVAVDVVSSVQDSVSGGDHQQ